VVRIAEPIEGMSLTVRKAKSVKAPIIKSLAADAEKPEASQLRVFEEYDKWYKVRTSEGYIGYIEKKDVVIKNMYITALPQRNPVNPVWKPEQGKINLVWEPVYNSRVDYTKINKMEGLDVISPTWFQVENDKGQLINKGDIKYVEWAHSNGYKVWALFGNDTTDLKMTSSFLNNTDARDNAIRQILTYASLLKLDGINIDFENIYKTDKDALSQFVRELTPLLKEQGLIVSMDIAVPDGSDTWSLCYDRKAIGQTVDYVMLMTYDQYWTTSPISGSVAQITWVEKNLKKTLDEVPPEKLLLGLPFYIRVWEEKPDKDNKTKVAGPAKVVTMDAAKKLIKDNNAAIRWDEPSGQYYAEYKKDDSTFKIWLEDETSIDLKASLAQKYNLAGVSSWSRNFETPDIWAVLNRDLKQYKSYNDWLAVNKDRKYVYAP
jgi:spore germination protein YaaH